MDELDFEIPDLSADYNFDYGGAPYADMGVSDFMTQSYPGLEGSALEAGAYPYGGQPPMPAQPQGGLMGGANQAAGQVGGFMDSGLFKLLASAGLLGLGGAGVGQALFGKPPTATTKSQTTADPTLRGMFTGQQSMMNPLAASLYGQGGGILNQLATGQVPAFMQAIDPWITQAFQSQAGDAYQQAVNAGRSRGFYDAPASSPAGGAVMGPLLQALQSQEAQAKLQAMQWLPQQLMYPAMQNQATLANAMKAAGQNTVTQAQQPQPSMLDAMNKGVIPTLGAVSGIWGAPSPQKPQQPPQQPSMAGSLSNPYAG